MTAHQPDVRSMTHTAPSRVAQCVIVCLGMTLTTVPAPAAVASALPWRPSASAKAYSRAIPVEIGEATTNRCNGMRGTMPWLLFFCLKEIERENRKLPTWRLMHVL